MRSDDPETANQRMIEDQIAARGVTDRRVLEVMRSIPRQLFVPPHLRHAAFEDSPLPLERGQTISQPFIVGLMTELLRLEPSDSVLEIGTGSGYQTAILARLARVIYSAEIEDSLADEARARLDELKIANVEIRVGDGVTIFSDRAPFDAILCAAAPVDMPPALIDQLAEGGRMIIPVGDLEYQYLWSFERRDGKVARKRLEPVRFVPLRTGSHL